MMFNPSNSTRLVAAIGFIICALLFASAYPVRAQSSDRLGTAQSFAVLGGETVTNTGATTVEGDLGVSPGTAITGFPPGEVTNGTIHEGDEVARRAQSDVTTAYNTLAGQACDDDLTDQDLGGLTLIPGVYCFSSSAQLTGALTLDAGGNPDAEFIFQIGSTLTTASDSSVLIIGGSPCNVFWQVGSSATLGTTTSFQGNILALTSITLDNGASVVGRALAQNGAVTMDTNDVSNAGCASVPVIPTATPEIPTATPEIPTATPEISTATPEAPASATPTSATQAPATSTPVESTPSTPTPTAPIPATSTPVVPIAGAPATATSTIPPDTTPTPTAPIPATSTPVVPIAGAPATATSTIPPDTTPTPTTPTPVTSVTPVSPATMTPAASTPTSVAPVSTGTTAPATATPTTPVSTSTPVPTGTAVTKVTFPDTGSGGLLVGQNDQPVARTNLAISIAIVVLLAGGFGVVVERRSRR